MPAPMLKVGDITIIPVSDGGFAAPPANIMPSVPAEAWYEEREHLNEEGNVPLNFGCFLVREGDAWMLVDCGAGQNPNFPGGKLLGEFEKARLKPEQISRVIITHLHPDHVGWMTAQQNGKYEPVFKNARHIVQRKDWDAFTTPEAIQQNGFGPYITDTALPVHAAGLVDIIDGEQNITPAIAAILTPGHTPGHQSLIISSGGEKAIIVGDVTHSKAQLNNVDWCPGFDMDADQSAKTRRALFDRIEQEGLQVCAGHYPYPSIGAIVRVEGKRRWQGI